MTDYIEIRNWDKFQHADATKRGRDPIWIKLYTRLHSDDDFLSLTGHQRAVLFGLWVEYARGGRHLLLTTRSLSARLNLRVMRRDIEAIEKHGFIIIRHDTVTPLSIREEIREEKKEQQLPRGSQYDGLEEWNPNAGSVVSFLDERRKGVA